jgi:UDP-N-acetylglucosamine 2-epimerase (non-hydrolysing)
LKRILIILGTRPEAIKLCPLVKGLRSQPEEFETLVCVTAQHREMLDDAMATFSVRPDFDLDLMQPGQTLAGLTARVLAAIDPVLESTRPDVAIVQGDTTTTMAGALAAFYRGIPVAHVEAGLRTGDLRQPFPEEMNRVLTTRLTALHFAPTARAAEALLREGTDRASVFVTGNTGIDAVLWVRDALASGALPLPQWEWLDPGKQLILVTSHRRENFGPGFSAVLRALARLAARLDVQIVYPVHRNPNVAGPAHAILGGTRNVVLLDPLSYVPFVDLMTRCRLIISDSGGIQEEAPSLGKPVLVLRDKTERPEAVEAGTVKLVGTAEDRIVAEAERLLEDEEEYARMTRVHNPYGDGRACERIAGILAGKSVGAGHARPPESRLRARDEALARACDVANGDADVMAMEREVDAISCDVAEPCVPGVTRPNPRSLTL